MDCRVARVACNFYTRREGKNVCILFHIVFQWKNMDKLNTAIKNSGTFDKTCPQTELFSCCFCFFINFPIKLNCSQNSVHSKSRKINNASEKTRTNKETQSMRKLFMSLSLSFYNKYLQFPLWQRKIHRIFTKSEAIEKEEAFFYGNCCIKRDHHRFWHSPL